MINRLSLINFRNYRKLDINFCSNTVLIFGENGAGKTNFLESIYFLSLFRSFRTNNIHNLKYIGSKGFDINCDFYDSQGFKKNIEIEYIKSRKIKLNNKPLSRSSDFIGNIKPVLFSGNDIKIIKGSSKERRKYINTLISKFNKNYLVKLNDYIKAIRSRNAILKDIKTFKKDESLLTAFEKIISNTGIEILNKRIEIINKLEEKADKILKKLKSEDYNLSLKYISKLNLEKKNTSENLYSILESERDKDIKYGYTRIGPHTDDLLFYLNGKNLMNYGSMGQCRLATLCVKMAEIELMKEICNDNTNIISLVDDITSELDQKTIDSFLNNIQNSEQNFISFVENKKPDYFQKADIFNVKNGILERVC